MRVRDCDRGTNRPRHAIQSGTKRSTPCASLAASAPARGWDRLLALAVAVLAPINENRQRDPHLPSLMYHVLPEAGVWSPPEAGSFSHVNRVASFSSSSMILSISAGLPPEAGIKPYAGVCMDRSNMATLYANAQWKSLAQATLPCVCMLQEHASGCGTFSSPRTST